MTDNQEVVFLDDVYVRLIDSMGSDDTIIAAARVSTKGGNSVGEDRDNRGNARIHSQSFEYPDEALVHALKVRDEEIARDKGLINYLMRDRHGSPFEHAVIQCYVKAPIFVFREWHRHRIASYNEMSGRYTTLNPEFYVPSESRPLKQVGKPGAYTFEPGTEDQVWQTAYALSQNARESWKRYTHLLEEGVAKEIARAVLPVNIYSQMYTTINLRSLMNFLSLRTKPTPQSKVPSFPQHEISLGADKLEKIFADLFPWTYEAWNANGRVAP